jgi:PAS domain S-box-containing protein
MQAMNPQPYKRIDIMPQEIEYIETSDLREFKRLLELKKAQDEGLDALRDLINGLMGSLPQGIVLSREHNLSSLLKDCFRCLDESVCTILQHPRIWSMVCDNNDYILDVSENLISCLGYAPAELIGAYKGMLWVERPDRAVAQQVKQAAYLIYEVKQRHFHGTHADAYIASDGRVIPILQHRIDLLTPGRAAAGYLYLIIDIRERQAIDDALTEIMDHIVHEIFHNKGIELTSEMKQYVARDMVRTHEFIDNVMENSLDAILVTSPAGLIISSNQSFQKLVGFAERELRNQPVTMVSPGIGAYPLAIGGTVDIDEEYFSSMADMIDNLFNSGKVYGFRQYFKSRNGTLILTEINISLLRDKQGEITGFVRNIHDLSDKARLQQEIIEKEEKISLLKKEITGYYGPDNIVGKSLAMQHIFHLVTRVADSDSTVLLQGESGTGKELIAHALYRHSHRSRGPFIVLNCGAIPRDLLESELFGHVRGAFTGAIRDKKGLFEEADGGVIFLDEIGELPLDMQVKLLRAIQEREIKRVGDNRPIKIDVRIIAATHKDLLDETRKKRFREDLYYRINVITIKIPPLRERAEDIALLIDFFVKKLRPAGTDIKVSRDALKILFEYSYPGNVRELENIVERALLLCEGTLIQPADLPPEISEPAFRQPSRTSPAQEEGLRKAVSRTSAIAEREMLLKALQAAGNNRARAAKILKIGRTSLYRKLKQFEL